MRENGRGLGRHPQLLVLIREVRGQALEKRFVIFALFGLLSSALLRPIVCDAKEPLISAYADGKERVCLDCHRSPNINTNEGVINSRAICMECHSKSECNKDIGTQQVSLQLGKNSFGKTPHRYVACVQCHRDLARLPHESEAGAQCLSCHVVHGEKEIHDPHLRVRCQACHRVSKYVVLDHKSNEVRLSHFDENGTVVSLTNHSLPDVKNKEFCLRCHFKGNRVGAAAAVLPSKSVICMLCHTSPISIGHKLFWIPLLLLVLGVLSLILFWFKGNVEGEKDSLHRKIALASEKIWQKIFSREIFTLFSVFFLDVILQRRLLQESVRRWGLHSLIYLSIVLRFSLSVFTLVVFNLWPHSSWAMALINKDTAFVAFTYDLLGLFIIIGVCWAAISRLITKPPHVISEMQDNLALVIIGLLVVFGFILEGARILITQIPGGIAWYSFIGFPLSRLLSDFGFDWPYIYQFIWYAHAFVGAALIAYLPFGKMKHVISTPLNLMISYKDE
ncbi:MAG: hypothetical protein DRG76_00985 [Deltaproteobacteria bacterium]|nr:MAG: hypothetical protein DRG76_00985 [Deltaproteobacteria bacterium]